MGILRKTAVGVTVGTAAALGYLHVATSIIAPIPLNDAIYSSSAYKKYNPHKNAATNDICVKTIPLNRIRPELLQKEGDLALELCRGVWHGWGESFFFFVNPRHLSLICGISSRISIATCANKRQVMPYSAGTCIANGTALRHPLSYGRETSSLPQSMRSEQL